MRRIYILIILFLFVFNNSFCQDTISIRLSVNDTYQAIQRISSIKISNGEQRVSNHILNDSLIVIDKFIKTSTNEIGIEVCVNSFFMKMTNLPPYVFTNGKWNIDFDYYPFSSENEIEARSDVDNKESVIVVLSYKSQEKNTMGMEFFIFQRKKDVKCRSCGWIKGVGFR